MAYFLVFCMHGSEPITVVSSLKGNCRRLTQLLLLLVAVVPGVAAESTENPARPDGTKLLPGFESSGVRVDQRNDIDPSSLPPDAWEPKPAAAPRTAPETGTFVSASGRALMYRYGIPDGVDPSEPQPVLIHFHGNNTGSQEQILVWYFGIAAEAEPRGLIPVVVASPETRNPPQEEVRQWMAEDQQLVHEFLQNGLTAHLAVDHDRIYFDGASQGTCFLHDFMQSHGEHYGGGFYGGCGCYNSPDPTWDPPQSFRERMLVYIHATTGDFLIEPSYTGYAYYKYTIGLNTRGDLEQEGAHCTLNSAARKVALDWFTGVIEIPEEPFQPHWSRISARDDIVGLAVDGSERIWKLAGQSEPDRAVLYRQASQGQDWIQAGELMGQARSFVGAGQNLFLVVDGAMHRTSDGGQSFYAIDPELWVHSVLVDGKGVVYRNGIGGLLWSGNAGYSWQSISDFLWLTVNRDTTLDVSAPRVIANDNSMNLLMSNADLDGMISLQNTPGGRAVSASWDGSALWAIAETDDFRLRLFRSEDESKSWQAVGVSDLMANYTRSGMRITALEAGKILVYGGYRAAWLTQDQGQTWQRILGLETGRNGSISAHGEVILYTNGRAAFRMHLNEFPNRIFRDVFEY